MILSILNDNVSTKGVNYIKLDMMMMNMNDEQVRIWMEMLRLVSMYYPSTTQN
jgi:hypothetical protein